MDVSRRLSTGDGTELAADLLPGDGPTVLLLHAGVADRRAWRLVAAALNGQGARVVAYDRRGFGETSGTDAPYSHANDLADVVAAAGSTPVWLVGNSQGGRIALDVALTRSELVAGLVLIAPAVSGEPEIGDEDLDPATRLLSAEIDDAEDSGDIDLINELEVRLWLDGPAGPAGRVTGDARVLALAMNSIALLAAQPEDAGQGDLDAWSRLEEIDVPATVVWGELDIPAVIDRCRTIAKRLPNAGEPIVMPGVAHLPSLERPDLLGSIIAEATGL